MLRQVSSFHAGPAVEKGNASKKVAIHLLDANKLAATITKNGGRGCSYLRADRDDDIQVETATAEKGKTLEKEWAYTRDHQRLALMIACVVCEPSEPQEAVHSILKGSTTTQSRKRGGRTQHLTEPTQQLVAKFRAGLHQASIGASDDTLKKIADWAFALFTSLKRIPVPRLPT